jgi:hypothetical protein
MPKNAEKSEGDSMVSWSQNYTVFECRGCFMFGYLAVGDTDGRGQEVATDSEL